MTRVVVIFMIGVDRFNVARHKGGGSDTEDSKGVDEDDAVRLVGPGTKYPARLELLVLWGGMYKPEGLEFKYTVTKHRYCYRMARSLKFGFQISGFGVHTELHRGEARQRFSRRWLQFMHCAYLLS